MAYNTGNAPTTTDKQHFEAFNVGYLSFLTRYQELFDVTGSDRKNSDFVMIAGGANLEEVAEGANFPETNPEEVGNKEVTAQEFKKKIALTRLGEITADPKTLMLARNLGMRAQLIKDQHSAGVFHNAFITTNDYEFTIDGNATPLVGTTQSIGSTGTTQSNDIASALSKAGLTTAKTRLAIQKDHDDELGNFVGKFLITGATNSDTAMELTEARADTTDNKNEGNINVHQGVVAFIWNQLEVPNDFTFDANNDTNAELADNWFLMAPMLDNPLKFVNILPLEFKVIRNPNNGNREYQAHSIFSARAVNYLGLVGSDGS